MAGSTGHWLPAGRGKPVCAGSSQHSWAWAGQAVGWGQEGGRDGSAADGRVVPRHQPDRLQQEHKDKDQAVRCKGQCKGQWQQHNKQKKRTMAVADLQQEHKRDREPAVVLQLLHRQRACATKEMECRSIRQGVGSISLVYSSCSSSARNSAPAVPFPRHAVEAWPQKRDKCSKDSSRDSSSRFFKRFFKRLLAHPTPISPISRAEHKGNSRAEVARAGSSEGGKGVLWGSAC